MGQASVSITQLAIVVRDVEATMRAYHATFGWGPWAIFEIRAPLLHDARVNGVPGNCEMIAAIASAGGIDIELFQPLGPGPLSDHLEEHGEGMHHILCRRSDGEDAELDANLRDLAEAPPVLEGRIGDGLSFSYIDLNSELKLVVETLAGVVEDAGGPDRIWPPESGP